MSHFLFYAEKSSDYADVDLNKFYADSYRSILSDAQLRQKDISHNRNRNCLSQNGRMQD